MTTAHTWTYLDPSGSQLGHKESGSEARPDGQLGAGSTRDHPGDCGNKTCTSGGAGGEPEPWRRPPDQSFFTALTPIRA
jgi:hypothetical protein